MQEPQRRGQVNPTMSRCVRQEWTNPSDASNAGGADPSLTVRLATLVQLIELSPVATLVVDEDSKVVIHNQAAARALSTHGGDLVGGRFHHPCAEEPYDLALLDGTGAQRIYEVVSCPFPDLGRPAWVVTLREHRALDDGQVGSSKLHDPLTGLANRELMLNRIAQTVGHRAADRVERAAVVALDLDRFSRINDWYGEATGDRVLRTVANRLTSAVLPGDFVSRSGGDEFAVLLAPRRTAEHLDVADRLASVLSQPIEVDGVLHLCSPVIGVAERADGDDERTFLAAAEDAARHAIPGTPRLARRQRDSIESMRTRALAASLPGAVSEGQMFLHYQPIFSVRDRSLVGLEALVRWEHPDDGIIAPDEFIRIADETGTIVSLGEWVLSEVCEQLAAWRTTAAGYLVPPVSINVASRQLRNGNFRHHALYQLTTRGLEAPSIRFEIGEQALVDDDPQVEGLLNQLAADGFAIDLDEFGTGVSSLTRLLRYPISTVKIARSFVARMMRDEPSAKIVLASIEIGHALGLPVTAIGVENDDQLALLDRWQCDQAQGYLLGRPLNPLQASGFFLRDPASLPPRQPGEPILRSGARRQAEASFEPSSAPLVGASFASFGNE